MKNKKIFGMPIMVLVIAVLAVGLGTAALVNYLSNQVTAEATVDSPITLQIREQAGGAWVTNIDFGDVRGGDLIEFQLRERNHANQPINAKLMVNIKEPGVDNVCEELDITVYRSDGTFFPLNCEEVANNLEFTLPGGNPTGFTNLPAGHDEVYDLKGQLAINAKGTYNLEVQHFVE